MKYLITFLLCAVCFASCATDKHQELRNSINEIIKDKQATVGVAIITDGQDSLTINNDFHYPMQSTYKFHLALSVLDYMHRNNIPLNHKIFIHSGDLLPDTYSPIRERYPEGNLDMSLADLLRYTISMSDNNGCDILFRFVGGTEVVDKYIRSLGFNDFAITTNEEQMHSGWDIQYSNWSTPYEAASLLETFMTKNILPEEYYDFLLQTMVETTTGENKIKALLPEDVVVAHKTGSSSRNSNGLKAAENDIAIIQSPDGRHYSLAIFVANSMENDETNNRIIADISKTIYDYLTKDDQ